MLYGTFFTVSGAGNILGRLLPRTPAARLGFSPRGRQGVGVLELLGGAGLLLGHYAPVLSGFAASGLFLLAASALQYHHWAGDRPARLLPAVVTTAAMLFAAATRFLG
ncbi:DoxX family protein [Streptomyces sp. TRM 70361]|uniref:DoxX family protein n=1 Tax=Streptomyces sp. TRM 70361 TaxID=3116553 RepID=UPI002E7AF357|nr:DoxX family protein [Streptomyces sp. TRM 70361]MEE1940120.1 DoxX family protein [Streptomyces sp. TRM 70361]